ncbi:MAG: lipopolysaccharide biosynthesis protein [Ktedonobacteraceae bacterium]
MFLQHSYPVSGKYRVIRPGLWRLSTATCAMLVSSCTAILIARVLGPADFGIYMFVLWIATVTVPAIGVGMSTVTSRHIAEIQASAELRIVAGVFQFVWQRQYKSILVYCVMYLCLAFPISWLFGASAPLLLLFLAGLSALPLLLSSVAGTTLRSLRHFDLLATIHLFAVVSTLLLMLLATQFQGNQVGIFLLASAVACTLTLAMALICIVRLLPMKQALQPGIMLRDRLTRGLNNSLLLFTLDVIVWQRSEMVWLARGHSLASLGFYALSVTISTHVIDISPTLFSTCILPLVLRYVPGQRYTNASDAFVKTSWYITCLAVPLCLGAIVFCPALISFCFGNVYLPAVTPLRILLISAAFGSVSTVSLTHLANSKRRDAQVWLGVAAAVLNVVLAIPLIALWGMVGAALASAAAQIVSATGSIVLCKKLMLG